MKRIPFQPMAQDPPNYHDYVIKDGQFIGKFDEMYRDVPDPWKQSTQPNKYSRMAGIYHLKNHGITSVLECGCGLGYYADWIYRETSIVPKSVDLSPVAVAKARALFPHLDFEVANVVNDLEQYAHVECVLLSEILWYILPDLNKMIDLLKHHFANQYLLVNQVFYKGTQRYGTDYFTSLAEFIRYMPFAVLAQCEATASHETTIETSTLFRIE